MDLSGLSELVDRTYLALGDDEQPLFQARAGQQSEQSCTQQSPKRADRTVA